MAYKPDNKETRKVIRDTINAANKAVDAGLMTAKEAIKSVDKDYQGIVSQQMQLNKLLEGESEKRKGLEGAFRRGLGYFLKKKILKKQSLI